MLWSSTEFGFCELPDAWSSGSSIMPQKKNPDAAELLRAKAPRVVAHLSALHGVIHALPLTYNKDLQEDKEHLFDAVDTIELRLAGGRRDARRGRASTASGWPAAAADELIAATDVADLLVRLGVPFREAHGVVAGLVRTAVERGKPALGADRRASSRPQSPRRWPTHAREFRAVLSARVLAGVEGLRGRHLRRCVCASSSRWPRRSSMAAACRLSSTSVRSLEVAPRADRLHRCATAPRAG